MAVSLPLVAWDTGYMLMRPHTMPGGSLHWPLWVPYALYGEVDHMYGFKQWNLRNPFAAAQSLMNLVETLLYLGYLGMWYWYGQPVAARGGRKAVGGRLGAWAVLLGFGAAVMTVSKTVLYCESVSGVSVLLWSCSLTGQGCLNTAPGSTTSVRMISGVSSSCGSSPSKILPLPRMSSRANLAQWCLDCCASDLHGVRHGIRNCRRLDQPVASEGSVRVKSGSNH
jgi:hypothetical protein